MNAGPYLAMLSQPSLRFSFYLEIGLAGRVVPMTKLRCVRKSDATFVRELNSENMILQDTASLELGCSFSLRSLLCGHVFDQFFILGGICLRERNPEFNATA